jgi:hypothetical protein
MMMSVTLVGRGAVRPSSPRLERTLRSVLFAFMTVTVMMVSCAFSCNPSDPKKHNVTYRWQYQCGTSVINVTFDYGTVANGTLFPTGTMAAVSCVGLTSFSITKTVTIVPAAGTVFYVRANVNGNYSSPTQYTLP